MVDHVVQYQVQKCGVEHLSLSRFGTRFSIGSILLVEIKSVANFHIDPKILKQPNLEKTILLQWRLWRHRRRGRDGPISMKRQRYTIPTPLNQSVPSDINLGLINLDYLSMEKLRRRFGREKMEAPWGHLAGWCVGSMATRDGCWPRRGTRARWSFDGLCDFTSFPPRVTSSFLKWRQQEIKIFTKEHY